MAHRRPRVPAHFKPLAVFRAERRRGLVHKPAYEDQMRDLQDAYDVWVAEQHAPPTEGS